MQPIASRRPQTVFHIASLASLCILALGGQAQALSFNLDTEFDTAATGPFVDIEITQNSGNLDLVLSLNLEELGSQSDLHEFYFNIVGAIDGLAITNTNAPTTEYSLTQSPSVNGGAGSTFEWGVNFGNGGEGPGNGRLTEASFTLSANTALTIADLMEASMASGGTIEIDMAAHIQGTSLLTGATSETVGGSVPVPEPSTALLLISGFLALGVMRRSA